MNADRRRSGFVTLVLLGGVVIIVGGLAGGAAVVTVMEQESQAHDTWRRLESEHAGDNQSVTDAEVTRLRGTLGTQLQTSTLFASLGTAVGAPGAESAAEAAGSALLEGVNNYVIPEAVMGASDPSGPAAQSTDGTTPTGGTAPPAPPVEPASGPITITITFRHEHDGDPNPIHLKRQGEAFSPSNRVSPGGSRTESFTLERGEALRLEAGRDGDVFSTTSCFAFVRTRFEVIWDDSLGLDTATFYCL